MSGKPIQLEKLVQEFAETIVREEEAAKARKIKIANRYAEKYYQIWLKIRSHGDEGREALSALLHDDRRCVRVSAAAFLLKYKTDIAMEVLKKEADGAGFIALTAMYVLKNWESGDWNLDD